MFVLRSFRIEGDPLATGKPGLAAKAAVEALRGPEKMLGEYLMRADIEAYDGRGSADFTKQLKKAKRFATYEAAFEFWRAQSKTRPLRPDGEPNRPLTAFHMTIERVDD
jgi:hypothetical protein